MLKYMPLVQVVVVVVCPEPGGDGLGFKGVD